MCMYLTSLTLHDREVQPLIDIVFLSTTSNTCNYNYVQSVPIAVTAIQCHIFLNNII